MLCEVQHVELFCIMVFRAGDMTRPLITYLDVRVGAERENCWNKHQ